jgi:hypothetical protein
MPKANRPRRARATIYDDRHLQRIFPRWLPLLYGGACGALIPWTIYLGYLLPPRYISHHWDVVWTGFDVFEIMLFALTALLAVKRSSWTALSSAMLGTVLLVDGWFDVMTASPGQEQQRALLEALVIELPLVIISFALSHRIFNDARHRALKP